MNLCRLLCRHTIYGSLACLAWSDARQARREEFSWWTHGRHRFSKYVAVGIVTGYPWVTQPGPHPHPYLPNTRGSRVYPSKRAQKQPKRLRIDWDMSKMVFFASDCLNHISVISELFGLFLGSFENWRVGASEPVPVPATTQPINPCGLVNPRQSLRGCHHSWHLPLPVCGMDSFIPVVVVPDPDSRYMHSLLINS